MSHAQSSRVPILQRLSSLLEKLGLLLLGTLLFLILLELTLRSYGAFLLTSQRTVSPQSNGILVLGESTSACMFPNESCWPAELQQMLIVQGMGNARVLNEAIPAYNTSFFADDIEQLLKKHQPALVIGMLGVNDWQLSFRSNGALSDATERLRIVKLFRWLQSAFSEHSICKKPTFPPPLPPNPEFHALIAQSDWHMRRGERDQAFGFAERATIDHPHHPLGWARMCTILEQQGKLSRARHACLRSAELSGDHISIAKVAELLQKEGAPLEDVREMLCRFGFSYGPLERGKSIEATKYNLHRIVSAVQRSGARYVAMQYPTLSLQPLQDLLAGTTQVTFVSNEENFRAALQVRQYNELFIDHFVEVSRGSEEPFYGAFGHCTLAGNQLIAAQVLQAILPLLRSDSVDQPFSQ